MHPHVQTDSAAIEPTVVKTVQTAQCSAKFSTFCSSHDTTKYSTKRTTVESTQCESIESTKYSAKCGAVQLSL